MSKKDSANNKDKGIVSSKEKDKFVSDLKDTIRGVGKIPGIIFAPIVGYVAKKYEVIPAGRKKQLEKIMKSIKENGRSGLHSLKQWFFERGKDIKKEAKERFDDKAKQPVKNIKEKVTQKVQEKQIVQEKKEAVSKKELNERKKFLNYLNALDGRWGTERIIKESNKHGFQKKHK